MRIPFRGSILSLAAFGALALAAPAAWAGCGDGGAVTPASWDAGAGHPADGLLLRVNNGAQSIVGLWNVQFLAGGNIIDFGYAAWHSDGTEIMNSGGRAPATENFCLGVWEQTGPFSYKLNHFALSYDAATGALNARVNIREDVVVDQKGSSYSGPFTIDVQDPNTGAVLQHVAGRVVGRRVTVNSAN